MNSQMNKLNYLLPKRSLGCVEERDQRERGRGSSKRDKRQKKHREPELKTEQSSPLVSHHGFNSLRERYREIL